jgi:ABC-type glutathione transport system ATPase component
VTSQPAVLSAHALTVGFRAHGRRGETRVLQHVDLDVAPGEIVALAGETGCGKTTLARALLGLVRPAAGEIRYEGEPLAHTSRALRRHRERVQLVPQDPTGSLNPRRTVYQAVAEGLRIHRRGAGGDAEPAVAAALERVGLRPAERFFAAYPHELSGGQRQRVVIAGALIVEPRVVVADEPVASLDAPVRGDVLALLLQLRDAAGLSMLITTHDLGLAWHVADRLAVMHRGRIVEIGPVEQMLTAPQHPYTVALVAAAGGTRPADAACDLAKGH